MSTVAAASSGLAGTEVPEQRRIVTILVIAQIFSGAGLAAGITVGGLLAQDMLGSTELAGLPSALFTTGSALTAVGVGRLSQARGRRPGLAAGYLTGALGAVGVVCSAVLASPVLLFFSLFVYGAGTATNLQARYAGADLAPPTRRARAISTVLVATTLGGVVGPNLSAPTGSLARMVGVPYLAGPFLLAAAAYATAAAVLAIWLRPDPLLLARALDDAAAPRPARGAHAAIGADRAGPADRGGALTGIYLGAGLMAGTQLAMVATMTMTPIFMHAHGHGTVASGMVIAVHVAAMYLPSPVTGRLVDRYGYRAIAAAAAVSMLAAGLLAAIPTHFAPTNQVVVLAVALALLGLGWNLGLLAGTTVITDTVPVATRATTQGKVDVAIAATGAAGGLTSGVVVDAAGYPTLTLAGAAISFTLLMVIAAAPPARRAAISHAA